MRCESVNGSGLLSDLRVFSRVTGFRGRSTGNRGCGRSGWLAGEDTGNGGCLDQFERGVQNTGNGVWGVPGRTGRVRVRVMICRRSRGGALVG